MSEPLTLYHLAEKTRQVIEEGMIVNEETGEIEFDFGDLDKLELMTSEKAEAVLAVSRENEVKARAVKEEADRLAKLAKAYSNKAENLKRYLLSCAIVNGGKIDTKIGTISIRKSKKTVIVDQAKIPEKYLTFKEPVPDKVAIKKAIESGEYVPGAAVVESKNLSIR